jgi:2-polyprenyl-3-methyl-5-hydroxy-6-metoxy-1,4-benzoquinol methylase
MKSQYVQYANSRLAGNFGEMSSYRFVYPYLKGKRVLDIGCSDGLYLKNLSKESVGIEQVPELSAACEKIGLNVINGDVGETVSRISDNSFEAVLFSHVMEHLDSPISMLRRIHRILVPGGGLFSGCQLNAIFIVTFWAWIILMGHISMLLV